MLGIKNSIGAAISDPVTNNIALVIANRGSNVGVWDLPVNGDFNSLDGFIGGVQTISASNANIVLTAPAGSITPSGGPTQAQNAVLRFTGTLTGNVQVTLPLPGYMIIENLTTGNFVLSFAAAASGQIIAVDQGVDQHIYNDGTNVKFINLGSRGKMEFWAGVSSMPAWVNSCTVPPYLLCDGSIYNYSTYPFLGPRLNSIFGGNGSTTFGVPDMRGRIPLAYDGTGTRITTAGCGLNGQTLGAALDLQAQTLTLTQLPTNIQSVGTLPVNATVLVAPVTGFAITQFSANAGAQVWQAFANGAAISTLTPSATGNVLSDNTGGGSHPNVQPSQVAGIWVVKT